MMILTSTSPCEYAEFGRAHEGSTDFDCAPEKHIRNPIRSTWEQSRRPLSGQGTDKGIGQFIS